MNEDHLWPEQQNVSDLNIARFCRRETVL